MKKISINAKRENLDDVLAVLDSLLEEAECPMKTQMTIDIAVEEIYINIASYAYPDSEGKADIEFQVTPEKVFVARFEDTGIPYNPLLKPDPDVTLSADERQVGGLGIYMVKKSMDKMEYERTDGKNILKLFKKI